MGTDFNADDQKLRTVLNQWKMQEPLPPRFQEEVWLRIARVDAQNFNLRLAGWFSWIIGRLARPAVAAAYICVLLVAGAGAGLWQARAEKSELNAALRQRYVQVLAAYESLHEAK